MHEEGKDKEKEFLGEGHTPDEQVTFWAFSAYILFFIPLVTRYRNHHFVKYHIKQGGTFLIVFIAFFLLLLIPGWNFLKFIIFTGIFILWCFGITYVLLGKERPLPFIGWLAEKYL
jgi:uncharacterized membrane protein